MKLLKATTFIAIIFSTLSIKADDRTPDSLFLGFTGVNSKAIVDQHFDTFKEIIGAKSIQKVPNGVFIANVVKYSAAEKSELKYGDVIFIVNGKRMKKGDEFSELSKSFKVGKEIKFKIRRPTLSSKSKKRFKWKSVDITLTPKNYLDHLRSQLKLDYDTIKKTASYKHKLLDKTADPVNLIIVFDKTIKVMGLRFKYVDDDWLFIRECVIATDKKNYTFPLGQKSVARQAGSGFVLEMFELNIDKDNLLMLNDILSSESVTIRYNGKTLKKDYRLGKDYIAKLKQVKMVYDSMDKTGPPE